MVDNNTRVKVAERCIKEIMDSDSSNSLKAAQVGAIAEEAIVELSQLPQGYGQLCFLQGYVQVFIEDHEKQHALHKETI